MERSKRGRIIRRILSLKEDAVCSVTPLSYPDYFQERIIAEDIFLIELNDLQENIFFRLVLSDENDNIYTGGLYKNQHQDHYLREIQTDLDWYRKISYAMSIHIDHHIFIDNDSLSEVVDRIISEYGLSVKKLEC